jgi:integrase
MKISLNQIVNDYLNIKSPSSVKQYKHVVEKFIETMKIKSANQITEQLLFQYKKTLSTWVDKKGMTHESKSATIFKSQIIVTNFCKYLIRHKYLKNNIVFPPLPKVINRIPEIPPVEAVRNLMRTPDKRTWIGFRDSLILSTLVLTGLRLSEIQNLKWEDIKSKYKHVFIEVKKGKGSKYRELRISDSLIENFKIFRTKYYKDTDPSQYVFLSMPKNTNSNSPQKLSASSYRYLVKKHALACGITTPMFVHLCRHICLSYESLNGSTPEMIKRKGGFSSLKIAEKYLHLVQGLGTDSIENNPLAKKVGVFG